mmetsp:Transcript_18998/g.60488  ORF Transcript_18998/g.60488 Transcript_18998/m.60488 type:complete len:224 (-) Transcript_18998:1206-1877(-)
MLAEARERRLGRLRLEEVRARVLPRVALRRAVLPLDQVLHLARLAEPLLHDPLRLVAELQPRVVPLGHVKRQVANLDGRAALDARRVDLHLLAVRFGRLVRRADGRGVHLRPLGDEPLGEALGGGVRLQVGELERHHVRDVAKLLQLRLVRRRPVPIPLQRQRVERRALGRVPRDGADAHEAHLLVKGDGRHRRLQHHKVEAARRGQLLECEANQHLTAPEPR